MSAAAFSRTELWARPLTPLPAGISLVADDFRFRFDLSKNDEAGAALLWLTTVVFTVAPFISFPSFAHMSTEVWVYFALALSFAVACALWAAWVTFSADSIVGTAETWELRRGFRHWAFSQTLRRADIISIALAREVIETGEGQRHAHFMVRLTLADGPVVNFGAGQPYQRIVWATRYLNEEA